MLRVTVAIVFAFFMRAADIAQAAHPIYPPDYIVYVCRIKEGQLKTYLNVYFARNDGATQIRPDDARRNNTVAECSVLRAGRAETTFASAEPSVRAARFCSAA